MDLHKKEFTVDIYTHFKDYYQTKGAVIITDEQAAQFTNIYDNNYASHDQLFKEIDARLDENLKDKFYCEDYLHIGSKVDEVTIYGPERGYISEDQKEMLLCFLEEIKRVKDDEPYKEFDFLYINGPIFYSTKDINEILTFVSTLETNNNNLHNDTKLIGWTKEEFLNLPNIREEQSNDFQETKKR